MNSPFSNNPRLPCVERGALTAAYFPLLSGRGDAEKPVIPLILAPNNPYMQIDNKPKSIQSRTRKSGHPSCKDPTRQSPHVLFVGEHGIKEGKGASGKNVKKEAGGPRYDRVD